MSPELRTRFEPEEELLLCCARTQATNESQRRVEQLLEGEVDWDRLLAIAARHGVIPLLGRHLHAFSASMPQKTHEHLVQIARRTAIHALEMNAEFMRLVDLFAERSITVLALKGPVLAQLVYGNAGLRSFGDLDFLVHPSEYDAARDLLLAEGYRPLRQFTPEEEAEYMAGEKSFEFVRGRVVVELHWSILHARNTYIPDTEELWARARPVLFDGTPVLSLPPEDLLFYLCAHGASHYWGSLKWLCDVAELLRLFHQELNWTYVVEQAHQRSGTRMLLLGLLLAAELLDAPLPPDLERRARGDSQVMRLLGLAPQWLFRPPEGPQWSVLREYFTFALRERIRDRVPFLLSLAARSMQLSERDHALVNLSPRARYLYYVVRPFRIISGLVGRRM